MGKRHLFREVWTCYATGVCISRQEPGRSNLNPQIQAACEFWLRSLATARPREVPVNPHFLPSAISYSDGERESAGVGVALWLPDGEVLGGYTGVPAVMRRMWSQRVPLADVRDIFQIEACFVQLGSFDSRPSLGSLHR